MAAPDVACVAPAPLPPRLKRRTSGRQITRSNVGDNFIERASAPARSTVLVPAHRFGRLLRAGSLICKSLTAQAGGHYRRAEIQVATSRTTSSATWPGTWYSAGRLRPVPAMNRWLSVG